MPTRLYMWIAFALIGAAFLYGFQYTIKRLEKSAYERGAADTQVKNQIVYQEEFQKQLLRSKEIDLDIERLSHDDVARILRERDELQSN